MYPRPYCYRVSTFGSKDVNCVLWKGPNHEELQGSSLPCQKFVKNLFENCRELVVGFRPGTVVGPTAKKIDVVLTSDFRFEKGFSQRLHCNDASPFCICGNAIE